MIKDTRNEYSVKTCPVNEPDTLEALLNSMAEEGWELYMLHEAESKKGSIQYNCIFTRETEIETGLESDEMVDVPDFKSRLEKMFNPQDEPYTLAKELLEKIDSKQKETDKVKNLLDSVSSDVEHEKLNKEITKKLNELKNLKSQLADVLNPEKMYERVNQERLTIVLSDELISLLENKKGAPLITETVKLRQKLTDELGYVIPAIKFTNSETLNANEYRIDVRGVKVYSGIVYPNYLRYYEGQSNITKKPKDSIEDLDLISLKKVFWIEESKTKNYWEKGLDPAQVITRNLEFIVLKYADEIMDYTDISRYVEIVGTQNLYLIENLIPDNLSVGDIRFILASLIRERVSVKDIIYIFEKLNDIAPEAESNEEILEIIRKKLSRQICDNISDENGNITAIDINKEFALFMKKLFKLPEETIQKKLKSPKLKQVLKKVSDFIKNSNLENKYPVIIAQPEIRLNLFLLFEEIFPCLSVISTQEVLNDYNLEIAETLI